MRAEHGLQRRAMMFFLGVVLFLNLCLFILLCILVDSARQKLADFEAAAWEILEKSEAL